MGDRTRPGGLHFETDPSWLETLRAWADDEPVIRSLWIFGSRASGVRREKGRPSEIPDLDIAFEVFGATEDERFQNAFVGDDDLKSGLSEQFGVKLDLQFMDGKVTPRVSCYVAATGWCFFERKPEPSGEGVSR